MDGVQQMLVQAHIHREVSSLHRLHLQIQEIQASSRAADQSAKRSRLLWTVLGFAGVIVVVGLSTWAAHPFASPTVSQSAARKPSLPASTVAFAPPFVTQPRDQRLALSKVTPRAPMSTVRMFAEDKDSLVSPKAADQSRVPRTPMSTVRMGENNLVSTKADEPTEGFRWPWQKKEGEEKEDRLAEVKKYGAAGIITYTAWKLAFNTLGFVGGAYAFYVAMGRFPDLSNPVDVAKVTAEYAAFVNLSLFAIPLRIGLTVATAPWVKETVIKQFGDNEMVKGFLEKMEPDSEVDWEDFSDDFKVVNDPRGVTVAGADAKQIFELVSSTPLNEGRDVTIEKDVSKGPNGEPILTAKWKIDVQDSQLLDALSVGELKNTFDFPLQVEGHTTFTLNEDGKVSSMIIGAWSVNGKEVANPDFKALSGADEAAAQKWAKELVSLGGKGE